MKRLLLIILAIFLITSPVQGEFFKDIILTSPTGIWTDSRAYTTLNAAVTAIGVIEQDLYIAKEEVVTTLIIPANIRLHFLKDGSIANSNTLTINTKNIYADHQIFTGAGAVNFASGSNVQSVWFTDFETAVTQTSNDTVTLIVNKTDTLLNSAAVGNNVRLKWDASNLITIAAGQTLSNIGDINAPDLRLFVVSGSIAFKNPSPLSAIYASWFGDSVATLSIADAAATVANKQLIIGSYSITSTPINPLTANLKVLPGSLISIATGQTLTINGSLDTNLCQIFSCAGTGKVVFGAGSVKEIYPEWWANNTSPGVTDMSAAIQAAVIAAPNYCGIIRFVSNSYVAGNVLITQRLTILGPGGLSRSKIIKLAGADHIFRFDGTGLTDIDYYNNSAYVNTPRVTGTIINGIRFDGNGEVCTYLVSFRAASLVRLQNVEFYNANGIGLRLADFMEGTIDECHFNKLNGCIYIMNYQGTYSGNNINNIHIQNNTFGYSSGNWIGAGTKSNTCLAWIEGNKFEWDGNPDWPNSAATSLIKLPDNPSRLYICNNGFTNFRPALDGAYNYYSVILELGSTGPATIHGNKLVWCDAAQFISVGCKYMDVRNNVHIKAADPLLSTKTFDDNSVNALYGEPVKEISSVGNLSEYTKICTPINTFIPASELFCPEARTLYYDAAAISKFGMVRKAKDSTSEELARIPLGSYVSYPAAVYLIIKVRVKTGTVGNASTVQIGGVTVSPPTAQAVSSADTWQWLTFAISIASLTNDSYVWIKTTDVNGLLLDGVFLTTDNLSYKYTLSLADDEVGTVALDLSRDGIGIGKVTVCAYYNGVAYVEGYIHTTTWTSIFTGADATGSSTLTDTDAKLDVYISTTGVIGIKNRLGSTLPIYVSWTPCGG